MKHLTLGSSLLLAGLALIAACSPAQAQYGSDAEQTARRSCWSKVLGSTSASPVTYAEFDAINRCVKGILGYEDPYLTKMKSQYSVPPKAGKIDLKDSVAGGCYAIAGVKITFNSGGDGTYEDTTQHYAIKWRQSGAQVSFTAPFGTVFYFRQTTYHGVPALKKGVANGSEAGPYVRGKCS